MGFTSIFISVIGTHIFAAAALRMPASNVAINSTSGVTLSPSLSPYEPNVSTTSRDTQCKVTFTVGYGYRRLFPWADSLVEKKKNGNSPSSATLNFRVRAFSDAHILLSPGSYPADKEPVYEIVIGGGKNTFSDIRRMRRGQTKASMTTREILSSYELRGFWIRLSSDGTIEVGREGDDTAFVGWQDPDPLPVRYFGFCTWTGTVGKWEYDCPSNATSNQEHIEQDESKMTFTQRLRRDLLTNYDPLVRPTSSNDKAITVYLHLACQHISLDDNKGVITVFGTMSMHWMDEKLIWQVEDYGGLKTLHAASYEIWLPKLLLYNAADGAGDTIFNAENAHVTVTSEGSVMWSPQAQLKALCALNMAAWPQDRHTCALHLGVWSHASTVTLKLMENGTYFDELQSYTRTEWAVQIVSARHIIEPHPWLVPDTEDDDDEEEYSDSVTPMVSVFSLEVTVQRRSSVYHTVLLTPVFWVFISMLASFFMSPLSWCRLTVCCLNLLFITAFNVGVNFRLPITSDSVPRIISVMSGCYYMATATLIATIVSIRLARSERPYPPPRFITDALNGTLGVFLILPPPPQNELNKIYGQLEDSKAVLGDTTSLDQEQMVTHTQWVRLATAIDRFLSFIYCITLSILILM